MLSTINLCPLLALGFSISSANHQKCYKKFHYKFCQQKHARILCLTKRKCARMRKTKIRVRVTGELTVIWDLNEVKVEVFDELGESLSEPGLRS